MAKIKSLVAGDVPSLNSAEKGNELIDAINALLEIKISPEGYGKITLGDKNAIIDLTDLQKIITGLSTTVAAMSTTTVAGGGGGGGSSDVANKVNEIIGALNGITIDAECDPVTRDITVTLNIDVPAPL